VSTVSKGRHRHNNIPLPAARFERMKGESSPELLAAFPPCASETTWPATRASTQQVLARVSEPPFLPDSLAPHRKITRRKGLRRVLEWLAEHPGSSWQERWLATGAGTTGNRHWRGLFDRWREAQGHGAVPKPGSALRVLICADVIRPSLKFLTKPATFRLLAEEMGRSRDPDGFAALEAMVDPVVGRASGTRDDEVNRIAAIMATKGGLVRDITVGDCLEFLGLLAQEREETTRHRGGRTFYQRLHRLGVFGPEAPTTIRAFTNAGQLTAEQLIDRYDIACTPIRDLLVDYLRERQTGLDYGTQRNLANELGRLFWKDLELHHPGIDSLRLTPEIAEAWKRRVQVIATSTGTRPRAAAVNCMTVVRAFYLDIAHWATADPAQWGPWVAPCPIRIEEASHSKYRQHRKARMDQRTRERLPVLPLLVAATERLRRESDERLRAGAATAPGAEFTVLAETFRRPVLRHGGEGARIWADDPETGQRRDLTLEEHRAFLAWAAVEVLRHTGIRLEELTELSHHSFIQYTLPTTGELIPLLHIAPSKTDTERLLVISPELADVLSSIVRRIRDESGAVPLVIAYDQLECVWNPPSPLLFQRRLRMENRPITDITIRDLLRRAAKATGITDASGEPLTFAPHDLRRIFVTDAVMNGMPPHIAQLVCGHKDINTTMGYKAVYPEEVINGHRAFITRRRALRPAEEYRLPTEEEWNDFLGHFERRKVALGTCGRAFATPCIHEHSCLRCPLLRPEPAQRSRLEEIRDNLLARIDEAEREGWLGEVEGLKISLAGAYQKLVHVDGIAGQGSRTVHLGLPAFGDTARIASLPRRRSTDSSE